MTIDFHAHILPGADHGSPNLEHSLAQLEAAKKAKVDRIVATPHFYSGRDSVARFLQKREAAYAQLLAANQTGIEILLGAEVQISSALPTLPELSQLAIRGTHTILLELPTAPWSNQTMNLIQETADRSGLKVVIAHIDRYADAVAAQMVDNEITMQVNASALCGSFLKRHRLLKLAELGYIECLGSDVHLSWKKSYQQFIRACQLLQKRAPDLMEHTQMLLEE